MLVASLGTPFEIHTDDTILFIEDIGEKPFRIDRMLMQLRLAGKLEKVRGFVFGEMLDCAPPKGETYTLQQVIMRDTRAIQCAGRLRPQVGPCDQRQYHAAHRRAGGIGGGRRKCEFEDSGSGNAIALSIQYKPFTAEYAESAEKYGQSNYSGLQIRSAARGSPPVNPFFPRALRVLCGK